MNNRITNILDHTLDADSSEAESADTDEQQIPNGFQLAAEALKNLDADVLVYAGEIQFGHEQDLDKLLNTMENPASDVILWLTTPGGNPDAAYLMARQLQRRYDRFTIFINGWCKSSGTLMCLGADSLIMGDLGQLGPLDIQILNREEFGERHSGLNPMEALKAISYQSIELLRQQFLEVRFGGGLSTRQALDVATNLTGQLMSPITCQLDIMKYGEFTRSMRIANEYGTRLASAKRKENVKPDAINLLTTGYPSHGFVIDREEASEALFTRVEKPDLNLQLIATGLQMVVDKHMGSANNRALLIDLRHALKVPLPAEDAKSEGKLNQQTLEESNIVDAEEGEATPPVESDGDESSAADATPTEE